MYSKIVVLVLMALSVTAQTPPSTDNYVLDELIPFLNATGFLLDGPGYISYAPTTPTTNAKPTLQQMEYYNYYSASMYCQYQLNDLSCYYCQKFKNDVAAYKVLLNNATDITTLITLSHTRGEIVVAFRGSQDAWNVVLDFTLISACYDKPNCNIKLHRGFYTAAVSVYQDVIKNIGFLSSIYQNYRIIITGHSLGASIARITTFFILYRKQFPGKKLEVYTYGEPRHGNRGYADFMNAQNITTARVTARADVAPHIYPVSVAGTKLLGDYYYHVQTEYWIAGENKQVWANTSTYTDPHCSDSLGPAYSVVDHFLYFDADYLVCFANAPQVFLALPANILQPIGTIPPLPPLITNFLSAALGFIGSVFGGLLG